MIGHIRLLIGSFFLFLQNLFVFPKIDNIYSVKNDKKINEEESEINEVFTLDKTIMSYNIHGGFDLRYNLNIDKIIEFINTNKSSIVCLQEVSNIDQFNYIKHKCNYKYTFLNKRNVILSNFEIKENVIVKFTDLNLYKKNECIHSVLDINGTNLNLFNIHFTSDFTGFKQMNEKEDLNRYIKNNNITDFILIGDTNSIELFERNDALLEYKKMSVGKTYPTNLPLLKLDKFYYKGVDIIESYRNPNIKYSDHLPINLVFKL